MRWWISWTEPLPRSPQDTSGLRQALLAGLVLLLAACNGSSSPDDELYVSAAASLTDAFGEVETAYEAINPDIDVVLNLAGSSSLREQILEGAPADVFASANSPSMDALVRAGAVTGEPQVFAGNQPQIAVPSGNPAGVTGLGDFANQDLLIGICAEGVPCGDLAREVLANAGVVPAIDSNEPNVRALLTKIETGELDAGITYVTDVTSTGGIVEGIAISDDENVVAEYPIAVMAGSSHPDDAAEFVDFVLAEEGQAILGDHGFEPSLPSRDAG